MVHRSSSRSSASGPPASTGRDADTYAVRRRIPPASTSQLRRLSPELQRIHQALLARHDDERLARRPQPLRQGE